MLRFGKTKNKESRHFGNKYLNENKLKLSWLNMFAWKKIGVKMKIISIKDTPEYLEESIAYFKKIWASPKTLRVYEDSIRHAMDKKSPLPRWYLLLNSNEIVGCAGLITNDFISRMDLYPWLCALYIEKKYRGNQYAILLIDKAKQDAKESGFENLYLCTDHIGYYERYGFKNIGIGYHPWGESSQIYKIQLVEEKGKKFKQNGLLPLR